MKIIRTMLKATIVTTGLGFVAYKVLLDDNAKRGVQRTVDTIRDSYRRINDMVEDITGIVIEEDSDELPNRKETLEQWNELGY